MAWLYKRPDSDKWWIGYRLNGRQFLRSTKTADKERAKAQLAKIEMMFTAQRTGALIDEIYAGLSGKSLGSVTLKKAVEDWLTEAHGANDKSTVERYRQIAEEFLQQIGAGPAYP